MRRMETEETGNEVDDNITGKRREDGGRMVKRWRGRRATRGIK